MNEIIIRTSGVVHRPYLIGENALAFLNCYLLLFPLNCFPDFSSLGPCRLFGALFLAWSPSAARPFLIDCPSGRPSERKMFDFKARERRRFDGKVSEDANCALSISMPTDEITIFILLTLQRYEKDFILQNFSAKKCSEK